METINVICVDDQKDVLDAVLRDLRPLEDFFRLEPAESAAECRELMDEIDERGESVGLVISDHVMPGELGVSLLGWISATPRFSKTKKILLTGQANQADTIRAINEAHIDSYFEKPWKGEELLGTVKKLLTAYILEKGIAYEEFMPVLDQAELLTFLTRNGFDT
ncbi:MAG: response regulator [Fibrobacter sp.]|jgi:two-component system chemotaxis response regulator CheY|nr:response regulator [Fibrobacter sp.]